MHRDFQVALAPLGIEPPHFGILTALEETGPSPSPRWPGTSRSAAPTWCSSSTTSRIARLVARRQLETDRRAHVIEVLPAADARPGGGRPIAEETVAERFAPLRASESRRLIELLRRVVDRALTARSVLVLLHDLAASFSTLEPSACSIS